MLLQIAANLFVTGPCLAQLLPGPIASLIRVGQGVGKSIEGVACLVLVPFDLFRPGITQVVAGAGRLAGGIVGLVFLLGRSGNRGGQLCDGLLSLEQRLEPLRQGGLSFGRLRRMLA